MVSHVSTRNSKAQHSRQERFDPAGNPKRSLKAMLFPQQSAPPAWFHSTIPNWNATNYSQWNIHPPLSCFSLEKKAWKHKWLHTVNLELAL